MKPEKLFAQHMVYLNPLGHCSKTLMKTFFFRRVPYKVALSLFNIAYDRMRLTSRRPSGPGRPQDMNQARGTNGS